MARSRMVVWSAICLNSKHQNNDFNFGRQVIFQQTFNHAKFYFRILFETEIQRCDGDDNLLIVPSLANMISIDEDEHTSFPADLLNDSLEVTILKNIKFKMLF